MVVMHRALCQHGGGVVGVAPVLALVCLNQQELLLPAALALSPGNTAAGCQADKTIASLDWVEPDGMEC